MSAADLAGRTDLQVTARAVAKFILAASILGIAFAALFPFDFYYPNAGLWNHLRSYFDSSPEPAVLSDKIINVVFFMPFGFGLAAVLQTHNRSILLQLAAGAVLGFAMSMTMETLQAFLGFRDPTWLDVLLNTVGALLGAIVVVLFGGSLLRSLAGILMKLRPLVSAHSAAVALIILALLQLALPLLSRNRGSLSNWDENFPLLVGNEEGGTERSWIGSVSSVQLADRAISDQQASNIHETGDGRPVLGNAMIASYKTIGSAPFVDETGTLKPLVWLEAGQDAKDAALLEAMGARFAAPMQPAEVGEALWLRTTAPVAEAVRRIRDTSQFTCITQVATGEPQQFGPARIVTMSGGIYQRNFAIMQSDTGLALRIRTPLLGNDGSAPETVLPDIFTDASRHQVILSYGATVMSVYVDGVLRGRMEITPEAWLLWRLYPRSAGRVRVGASGFYNYSIVYRLLIFIPFAALLAAATALSEMPARAQLATIAASILVMALAMEAILALISTGGFIPLNLLLGILIAAAVIVALRCTAQRRAAPAA